MKRLKTILKDGMMMRISSDLVRSILLLKTLNQIKI